jgi:hypothetical protein
VVDADCMSEKLKAVWLEISVDVVEHWLIPGCCYLCTNLLT